MSINFLAELEEMQGFLSWKRKHHPDWPDLRLEWGLYHHLRGSLAMDQAADPDLRDQAEKLLAEGYRTLAESQDASRSFSEFAEWDAWTLHHLPLREIPSPAPRGDEIRERFLAAFEGENVDIADHLIERIGDLDTRPEPLRRAALGRPFRRLLSSMAEYLAFQGRREDALEAEAWSVLVGGSVVEHWLLSARIERICGRRVEAGEILDAGLERFPESVPLMRERAEEYEMQGKVEKAAEVLEEAVRLRPKWPDLRLRLARVYQELEQRDLSLDQFEKALELNPRYESAARGRAELLKDRGRHEEAEALLQAWTEDKIPHAEVFRMLSEIYAEREDYMAAERFARLSQSGVKSHEDV